MRRLIQRLKQKIAEIAGRDGNGPVLIHIGKCGGSSVQEAFIREKYAYIEKHVVQVKFKKRKEYIIVIRNPISRFVSAFNWRYKLVVEDGVQASRFEGEKALLEQFGTANRLAESIYDASGELKTDLQKDEFYIHHIKEDIHYHLGGFLKKCKKENILAVLATETLEEDMQRHFNMDLGYHLKKNKKEGGNYLSELAIANLKRFFEKDYMCIEQLNELNLLTKKQYQKLSE